MSSNRRPELSPIGGRIRQGYIEAATEPSASDLQGGVAPEASRGAGPQRAEGKVRRMYVLPASAEELIGKLRFALQIETKSDVVARAVYELAERHGVVVE